MQFDYEPTIGERRPDYLVHSRVGPVLCEIKDFDRNDEDRAELDAALAGQSTFGSKAMPFARIQLRIRAARSQLREYKGQYPCLVVLFDPLVVAYLSDLTVLGAMYGESKLQIPIDFGGGADEPRTVFDHETRYLTPTSNTTISAVAILDLTRPNQHILDEAIAKQNISKFDRDGTRELASFITRFSDEHPEVFDQVPRLQFFNNVFAAVPWPESALKGPHDLMWPQS